jgi:hypothetical protein
MAGGGGGGDDVRRPPPPSSFPSPLHELVQAASSRGGISSISSVRYGGMEEEDGRGRRDAAFVLVDDDVDVAFADQRRDDARREREVRRHDALRLLDGMCRGARECDATIARGRDDVDDDDDDARATHAREMRRTTTTTTTRRTHRRRSSLLRRILLHSDDESGYTPLHRAMCNRDLTTTMLLLGHGLGCGTSSSFFTTAGEDRAAMGDVANGSGDDDRHPRGGNNAHPLQFLNDDGGTASTATNDDDRYGINGSTHRTLAAAMARSIDREGLTPLMLLGRTSASDLGRCRSFMSPRLSTSSSSSSYSAEERRWRGESGWFRNLDSDVDVVRDDDDDDNGAAEQRDNNDDDDDGDGDGDDDVNIGFHVADDDDREGGQVVDGRPGDPQRSSIWARNAAHRRSASLTGCEYGCEVLAFGRADHCAMGVPGARGGAVMAGAGGGGPMTGGSSSSLGCHAPRRVEMFGLGDMRRTWSSSRLPTKLGTTAAAASPSNGPRPNDDDDDGIVDSPAIAVSASTHHTLVLTRSGRLFAFGYGKSGRLGTGDVRNRNLPVRVLGQLTRRVVMGIAAAVDHSLCCTDDGELFAWGSNGFGQLGHSGADRDDGAISAGRLSPRRVEGGGMRQAFVVAVAAGDRHSVALTRIGEVYCWGDNRGGQLGIYGHNGDVGGVSSPVSGRPRHLFSMDS